ncbi:iron uptake porin [Aerosakkonema sp. BLCC-F183]|uniref:iron uptake porin n=1 Tax=Aerosakkonema sp. BLCC-F183 TaxID=3342834 RepID=UPI0035B9ED2C
MQKLFWQTLLFSPAILVAGCVISCEAIAQEVEPNLVQANSSSHQQVLDLNKDLKVIDSIDSIDRQEVPRPLNGEAMAQIAPLSQLSPEPINSQAAPANRNKKNPMGQVTSVSQLSDVQPTDWAFQALQSLVERYGCIEGYPDRTYRGNRAMTRYEFAAGLNSCLNRIQELIGTIRPDLSAEDLERIRRLQEEFRAELSTLRGRVDALEARTTRLEAQQFSTTTKLSGLATFNITTASIAGDKVKAEGLNTFAATRLEDNTPFVREVDDPQTTLSYVVWLTFNTSFTGKDNLLINLAAGNGNSPVNQIASAGQFNTTGVNFFDQTAGANPNQVIIRDLVYTFPVSNNLRLSIGPRINWYSRFDGNAFTLPFNTGSTFNAINSTFLTYTKRGAGAIIEWNISKQFELRAGYLTESIEFLPGVRPASDPNRGLFNGADTITAEVTFKPVKTANLRLLYQRSNISRNQDGQIAFQPIVGVADDGFGGRLHDATSDTFGVNFDWLITRRFGIFGRYYYTSAHLDPITPGREDGDINAQNIQAGLAFPDLGKRGAMATISFVVPFDILDGREFLVSGGGNGGTQYDIELGYFFPVTENIAVVPALYIINNINNFDDNPTVFVGNVRTQFSF